MTRWKLIILTGLAVVLLPAVMLWSVLYTEAGARWALGMVRDLTGDAIAWQRVDGSVAGGLTLVDLTVVTGDVEIAVTQVATAATLSLLPPGLVVRSVEIQGLRVNLESGDEPQESAVDLDELLESLQLPLPVRIESLQATDIVVELGGERRAGVNELRLELDWHKTVNLRSFTIDGGDAVAASGDLSLDLHPPFEIAAAVAARADTSITRLPTPLDASLQLGGSLRSLDLSASEAVSGLTIAGKVTSLLEKPAWDLEATLVEFVLDADAGRSIRDAEISTAGTIDTYAITAQVAITGLVDASPVTIDARATGSNERLDIAQLELSHPTARLGASGRLDFPARFSGPVDVYAVRLDRWLPDLDETHVLSGRVDTVLTTERVSLQHGRFLVDGTDLGLDVGGTIDLNAGSVDLSLAWQTIDWPFAPAAPRIQSRDGGARITGTLDSWNAEFSAVVAAPGITEGRLAGVGAGTQSGADFELVEGDVFGAAIDGSASVNWENELQWSAEAIVRGLRTASVLPAYPGILTTHVRAGSTDVGEGVDIEIVDLRGTLLDEELSGSGGLFLASREVAARDFRVSHGASRLGLDGSLFATAGLDFELVVPDLALYRPSFAGDLELRGRVSLRDEAPLLMLEGSSREIRAGELGITGLHVTTTDNDTRGIDLYFGAEEFTYGTRKVEDVDLNAVLNAEEQRFTLTMMPLGNQVSISARGSMREPGKLTGFPWQGTLEEFSLVTRDGEGGGIDYAVPIEFAPDRVRVEDLCLSGEQRGELCASIVFGTTSGLDLDSELDGVPINVLNAFLQTGFDFEQTVSGSLQWDGRSVADGSGMVSLKFTPGQLKSSRFPSLDLRTGAGELSFEVAEGALLAGGVSVPLGVQGFIDGNFNVDDISRGADSPVRGELHAETSDVDVFASLLPDIDGAKGHLRANLAFGGTVGQPLVTGTAAFKDGEINYFPLGLALAEINVDGRFDEDRHVELGGTFRAGEGRGEITTRTSGDQGEEPGIHLRIRGDGLKLVELPDVSATADADLTLDYRNRRVDINGSINVPRARIRPVNLVTARVDESEDVVIVAGSLPDTPEADDSRPGLSVHGKLALGVGDDVQVILDVARASIDGLADFEWSGDPIPIGRGRYNINGTVEAFGQVLNISEGRVRFPGVPATEPLLDIRATRDIYGNTQIKRAGILVQGSILRPTIEAYTYPVTTEERALTLLVTGNDFDYEQGVGAIDFGTYIAPRLFLSYGVGVFDRENIVTARYDLTTGFGIRATSGSRESGVDLTYRLER